MYLNKIVLNADNEMLNSCENVIVARICHDLITPCNAVNLGLEAYEMSNEESMLSCVKDGIGDANTILIFMRELFSSKSQDFIYSKLSIARTVTNFLKVYNIESNIQSAEENIPYYFGIAVLHIASIMKELMPFGGKVIISVENNSLKVNYTGTEIRSLDVELPEELTYKNVLRFKLLDKLRNLGGRASSSISDNQGVILLTFETI